MHYDFLRASDVREGKDPFFLFATSPLLSDTAEDVAREEAGLVPNAYYHDSTEFCFDDAESRDQAVDRLRTALETHGHSVRILKREVEIKADDEPTYSLFEESTVLH